MTTTIQEAVWNTILPHFEAQQRQGQDNGRLHLSLDARVRELNKELASLELGEAVEHLTLEDDDDDDDNNSHSNNHNSQVEKAIGTLLVQLIDATVASDATSDLSESVDRVLALIAAFGLSYSTPVATLVMDRAVEFSTVLLERIRGHACLLLGKIAQSLMETKSSHKDEEWVEENLNHVLDALVPRLQDKGQAVRCQAIRAIGGIFGTTEATETYEGALESLLWSVAHDPSVSNRIMAVQNVPVTSKTLDVIISRVRDIKPKVRAEALHVLRNKAEIATEMTETQLVDLIQSGFTNRCAVTMEAASKMVCAGWMKAVKYDPIALLKLIGVMDNEEEAIKVLQVVLEAARSEESDLLEELSDPEIRAFKSGIEKATVPLQGVENKIEPEQLFFLRSRCQSVLDSTELTSSQKDTITNNLIPEIPVLCEVFEHHATDLMKAIQEGDEDMQDTETFNCLQLLQFAKLANIQEEGSRRHFAYVMKQMLSSVETPDDLIEGCLQALHLTYENESDFVDCVSEIINDVVSTSESEEKEGDEETMGTMRTLRILSILSVVLEKATSQLSNNPAVKTFAKHIVPSVTHSDALIREAAVGCFGKLGLFTQGDTILNEFKPILLGVASHKEERIEIRAQALLALSDWSMLFSDVLKACDIGEKTVSFSDIVADLMMDSRTGAVCIAAEIAAKLLFSGRVCDSAWLAQLLAIFFDQRMVDMMDEDEDIKDVGSPVRLQQLLTMFFPAYCMKNELGRDALMGSILPMLELIYFQPPLAGQKGKKASKKKVVWPVVKMIQYVCSMVDAGKPTKKDDATVVQNEKTNDVADDGTDDATQAAATTDGVPCNSTSLMASVQIAEFLVDHSEDVNVTTLRSLCKLLGASDFNVEQEEAKKLVNLKQNLEELGMVITDTTSLGYLSLLNVVLSDFQADDEEADEEEPSEENEADAGGKGNTTGNDVEDDDTESEDEAEVDPESDDDDIVAPVTVGKMNLSSNLMEALNDVKITDDDDSCILEKENNGKRESKGRKNSSGSAASRRSRLKRLSDISAN